MKLKVLLAKEQKRRLQLTRVQALLTKTSNEISLEIQASSDGILCSPEWKALRKDVLAKYGAVCMCCHSPASHRVRINIDHIKPRLLFPELSLSFENLQVLCGRCNKAKGNKHCTDYRPTI